MQSKETDAEDQSLRSSQVNTALGLFLLVFGLIIIAAIFFTPTLPGKVTNLICGAVLSLIGGGMILMSRRAKASSTSS